MRKWILFCLIAALGCTAQSLRGDAVDVGLANFSNCLPFGCATANFITEYQQVYSSSSFFGHTIPFDVAAVSFFTTLDPTPEVMTPGTYTISFSTTSAPVGGLDTTTLSNNVGLVGSQLFFSGTLGGTVGTELTIGGNGATPIFVYDPTQGNLLLDITISSPGQDTGITFDAETPSSLMSRAAPGIVDSFNLGLVTEFSTTPPPATPVPEPSSLALLGNGLLAAAGWARRKSIP